MGTSPHLDLEKANKAAAMTPTRHKLRPCYYRILANNLCSVILLFFFLGFWLVTSVYPLPRASWATAASQGLFLQPVEWKAVRIQSDIRIAKATILYEGSHGMYDLALKLHNAHNERFGYNMHVLRSRIVKGGLNKALWLQQLIIAELQKPVEEQVEWILYFDPSVILSSDRMPLHTFLPPITDFETFKALSIIATKPNSSYHEHADLSTSMFFIRASGDSLRILTEAMVLMYPFNPAQQSAENFAKALQLVLGADQNRDKAIYQPHEWYDGSVESNGAMFRQPFSRDSSPAHDMEFYLEAFGMEKTYNAPKPLFPSPESAHLFWHSVSEARMVLNEAKERGQTAEQGEWREMVKEARDWVELRAYDTVEVNRWVEALREGLEIE